MPPFDLDTILSTERDLMNRFAADFETNPLFTSYFYEHERRRFISWVLEIMRLGGMDARTASILETGQSAGGNFVLLEQAGCQRLTGMDIAEEMINEAKRHVPRARYIHGSIEHHDFGNERFDAILAKFTLHHMYDARAFFSLVDRVLAPGGWFFICEYNAAGWSNARWTKPVIETLVAPLRRTLKWKNRKKLCLSSCPAAKFNPAHRLLTYPEILAAMPSPENYSLLRRTRGVFLPAFNYAIVESSAFDRGLYRVLDTVDRIAEPFKGGNLQWIAGKRLA